MRGGQNLNPVSAIRYRPEVDGLRAVAILPVIAFHLAPSALPGGFVGVDVFFVISGYLITSIIMAELAAGTFTFRSFWERRARRIFPPLAIMVLACLLISLALRVPIEHVASLGRQALRVVSFTANHFMHAATGDYWGADAEAMPLLHTWSLAVEEQFYLVYPALLFVLWRFSAGRFQAIIAALAVASLACCIWLTPVSQSAAFFLLPSRAWELLAGALAALLLAWRPGLSHAPRSGVLSAAGLLLIAMAIFGLDGVSYPGWKAILPVAGSLIFVIFSGGQNLPSRALASPAMVYIGRTSYSTYLWHWPALVIGGLFATLVESPWPRPAALAVAILCALASYHWVEPAGKRTRHLVAWGLVSFSLIAGLSLWMVKAPPTLPAPVARATRWQGLRYESINVPKQLEEVRTSKRFVDIDVSPPADTAARMKMVRTGSMAGPARMVVLGDSHGMMWGSTLQGIADAAGVPAVFAVGSAIPPFLSQNPPLRLSETERAQFNRMRLELLAESKPAVVLVVARWDAAASRGDLGQLANLLAAVRAASPASHIVILGQPPMLAIGDQNLPQWLAWRRSFGLPIDTLTEAPTGAWSRGRTYLREFIAQQPGVTLVELDDLYRDGNGRVRTVVDDNLVYTDDDHLSDFGASMAMPRLSAVLNPLLHQ